MPRRDVPQLHQPDGDELLGDQPRQHASRPSGCATACRAPPFELARDIGVPHRARSTTSCAGINHMAFYLRFERDGEDLYPLIRAGRGPRARVPDGQPGALRDAARGSATSSPSRASTSPSTCRGSSSATGPT